MLPVHVKGRLAGVVGRMEAVRIIRLKIAFE